MTSGILLLPILSLGYLAYEIRNGNNEILSGSAVIEKGSVLVKDQAQILSQFCIWLTTCLRPSLRCRIGLATSR